MLRTAAMLLAICALLPACTTAGGVEVRLTVTDDANVARSGGLVTSGVPLAKGAVRDLSRLSVAVDGRPIPAQFLQLAPWEDGSVRWALMDCQVSVPAGGRAELTVRDDGRNPAPPSPVVVGKDGTTVGTGPLQLVVGKSSGRIIDSLRIDGRELLTAAARGLVIWPKEGEPVAAAAPTSITVEQAGPMRAIVCLRGTFPGIHDGLMGYTVRLTAFAGSKVLKAHVWLENHGAHGYAPRDGAVNREWFLFDGMAFELGLGLGDAVQAACEGAKATGKLKVLQFVNPPKRYTEPEYILKDFQYKVTRGAEELATGQFTDGVVTLTGAGGTLTTAIRHFWQNYEKAIELDGSTLKFWLWPTEGQYPRKIWEHPCPGYANGQFLPLIQPGFYNFPGSVEKGHELILDFSGRPAAETSAELSKPLFALASAEHYASTEAAPGLFAPPAVRTGDDECDAKLAAWMRMTRSVADPASDSSIWHARRDRTKARTNWTVGFWYGWMDFGDLAVPGHGAVSLHYDWPWIVCTDAMRTGDLSFLRLATEMTRHRVDVDQQWSDREIEMYRGYQRCPGSYAHFHCVRFDYSQPSVTNNWMAGVALYYMLTGEPKALECMQRGTEALVRGWKMLLETKDYSLSRIRGDMQTVARSMFSYCSMYELTADRTWLDEALKLFNVCVTRKWETYGPHLHDPQQIRSQDYTEDDIGYCYSIQAFCLLHHLTGDEKLFELLKAGCDEDFGDNFFDAPLFLADLNAYVAVTRKDEAYLDKAVEHWVSVFPESKNPPVYLPDNSTWSSRRAMVLRTGHILQYASWKMRKQD